MLEKNKTMPKSYVSLFSLNYFIQGCSQAMFAFVIPFYMLMTESTVSTVAISFMMSFVLIPFTLKFLFGMASDKFGTKRFGRRKLWIVLPSLMAGGVWILLNVYLSYARDLVAFFSATGIIISLGIALTDTGIDGYILDNCPFSQLGRVSGVTWAARCLGTITGASGGLLLLTFLDIRIIFIGVGLLCIIFSSPALLLEESKENKLLRAKILLNVKNMVALRGDLKENLKVIGFSFFISIIPGLITVLLSLIILSRTGLVNPKVDTIDTLSESVNLYWIQAIIIFFINVGIFCGSIIGGLFADKVSRKKTVYLAFAQIVLAVTLLLIPSSSLPFLFFLAVIAGWAAGWNAAAFLAVVNQYSKKYPEATATYQTTMMSVNNAGVILGLSLTGILLTTLFSITSDVFLVYTIIFFSMTVLYLIALVPFAMMDSTKYEYKYK